jgi:hypothetical protein
MINRIPLAVLAGTISVVIAGLVFFGASWFAETVTPSFIAHHRVMAFLAPTVGVMSGLFPIFYAMRQRRAAPEEPMKPRIRNGRIG